MATTSTSHHHRHKKSRGRVGATPLRRNRVTIKRPDPMRGYGKIQTAIVELLKTARRAVARSINAAMTATYWEIGRRIVQFEQGGGLSVPLMAMPLSSGLPRTLRSASAGGSVVRTSGRCAPSIVRGLRRRFARHCLANLPSSWFLRLWRENPQLELRVGNHWTQLTAYPLWGRHSRCRGQLTSGCYQSGAN